MRTTVGQRAQPVGQAVADYADDVLGDDAAALVDVVDGPADCASPIAAHVTPSSA
ncbi:MAG: hypothetical protein IPH44_21305 [Myxococcales bacterium]|nr:hypothetical protein [Myxococcales bacterium]